MTEDLYSESSSQESDSTQPPEPPPSGSPWFVGEDQQTVISSSNPLSSTQPRMQRFSPTEVGEALQGIQLEHFVLEQYVGGGGMGAVFRGNDKSLGRVVAIKVVSSRNTDGETLRRFRNEAQSAARLDHPNIARVYYVGEDQGWNFIVFEFIDGVNVRELVQQHGELSVAETVRYALHIAAALEHAAEREVVHRDIKPSNILVTRDGQAKLVDMGLARLHQVNEPIRDITQTGVTLGTFDYISPEQARDPRSADVRSDLYSLGCTLYFMLTAGPPFPDGNMLQKLLSHNSESPADLREHRPELSDDVAAIVDKLMAKQPAQRYQSPKALIADLLEVTEVLGLEGISYSHYASPAQTDTWHSHLLRQSPWLVPIVVLLLAGFVMRMAWSPATSVIPEELNLRPPSAPALNIADVDTNDDATAGVVTGPTAAITEPPVSNRMRKGAMFSGAPERVGSSPLRRSLIVSPDIETTRDASGPNTDWAADALSPLSQFNGRDLSATTSSANERPATTTIVVGSADDSAGPGELVVPTLQLAIQRATEFPQVDTIELRFSERDVAPINVDLRRDLTIRAADPYQPRLVFRPNGGLLRERWMFRVSGNHAIRFEGIHCQLELPYEAGPPCGLFELNQINQISLNDCTLTIRNEFGVEAAFFTVEAPSQTSAPSLAQSLGEDEFVPRRPPSIELDRTIARGQATLVRAVAGSPFWVSWEQGLFASTDRMVECGGLLDDTGAALIRIDLANVTASMDRGLCRVTIDDSGPYLPAIDIDARNCVLAHPLDQPFVEHLGINSLADAEAKFSFAGQNNYYESTDVGWRVVVVDEGEFRFQWADQGVQWHVRWADNYRIKSAVPWQTPADYRLHVSQRGLAGFDESKLPVLSVSEDE